MSAKQKKPKTREQILREHELRIRVRREHFRQIPRGFLPRYRAPQWIVIRVVTGQERFASEAIRSRLGNEVYYPKVRTGPEKLKAQFPGYIFAKICDGRWMHLQFSPGVVEVVKNCGQAARIDDREIKQMIRRTGRDGYIDLSPPPPWPRAGDQLYILKGVFKFWIVSYIADAPDKQVRAAFDFMGKRTEIKLRRSDYLILGRNE